MRNNAHHDAHAFATSRMTGFPINGSHAAITGAMMHRNKNKKLSSGNRNSAFKRCFAFVKDTKYCKHCGVKVNMTANYCKNCGKEL